MNEGYIALIDSGIGGMSMLLELMKVLPNERYLYFGDNFNAPYGNKSINELREITLNNIDFLKRYNIKLLVVACNTLSVNLLKDVSDYSGIKTFGVFPPIEKAVMENQPCLLLSTKRTAENFKNIKGLTVVGLENLAREIEENQYDLSGISISNNLSSASSKFVNKAGYYKTIILGCTHYFFVKDKIFDHLKPQKIIFGEYFTARAVKNYLKSSKSLENNRQNQVLFIGENSRFNKKFFNFYGQNPLILN